MRRAKGALVLGLITLVAALVTGRDIYFYVTYVLLVVLFLAAGWAWFALRGLRLGRYTQTQRAQVGRSFEERFLLRNAFWLPKPLIIVDDHSELPGHHAGRVIRGMRAHGEFSWTGRVICRRRGRFRLGPVTITASDPLGLFEFRRRLMQTSALVVYPSTVSISRFPQPRGYLPGGQALRWRTHQVTTNAAGVREYAPGDSFSRIHWPSTARASRLIVKEFELDPMLDVWIFLDMRALAHVGSGIDEMEQVMQQQASPWSDDVIDRLPPSTEEYAVAAAASVARHFIAQGRSVGLVSYGQRREVLQADRDERQLVKILETLAVLRAEGDMPFGEVLGVEARKLMRGTTVVAITPAVQREWVDMALMLDRNGIHLVAILVDVITFGGPMSTAPLQQRLLARGVPALSLRNGEDLERSLSAGRQAGALHSPSWRRRVSEGSG